MINTTHSLTWTWHSQPTQFDTARQTTQRLLRDFDPIGLAEMGGVALLDRTDTKYIVRVSQLYPLLQSLAPHYQALDINQTRLNHYLTLYFDTHDFALYNAHHNGVSSRYKIRARKYLDTDLAFFEVKHKTNKKRTVKSRFPIPDLPQGIEGETTEFVTVHTPYAVEELEPKLWNDYYRMTLVSCQHQERVTLDLNLMFYWEGVQCVLPGIVVAEVKQGYFSRGSHFIQHMRRLGIRPFSFSKYIAGVYSLYDAVKTNAFKRQIRLLNQMMQEETHYESLH